MTTFLSYEDSRKLLIKMEIDPYKKLQLINDLNRDVLTTKEDIKSYESKFCKFHNIEVDLLDLEFGSVTVNYSCLCENEELAKQVTEIRVKRNKKYSQMEIKGMYLIE